VHAPLAPLRITALGGGMLGEGRMGTGAAAATAATTATSTSTTAAAAATATTIVAGLRGLRYGGYIGPERLRVV